MEEYINYNRGSIFKYMVAITKEGNGLSKVEEISVYSAKALTYDELKEAVYFEIYENKVLERFDKGSKYNIIGFRFKKYFAV